MFTLRRAVPPLARRGMATVTVEAPAAETAGRRRRKQPPKRPDISLKAPRTWNRPLAPGVVPAYDLALTEITRDSNVIKKEAAELRTLLTAKQDVYAALKPSADSDALRALDAEVEAILKKLSILDVQSEVNLPWIRWKVNNAMGTSAPVVLAVHAAENAQRIWLSRHTGTSSSRNGERTATLTCWYVLCCGQAPRAHLLEIDGAAVPDERRPGRTPCD